MDARQDVSFNWKTFTQPFATQTPDYYQYQYYKLEITSDTPVELAELELMSATAPTLALDMLNKLIADAETERDALNEGGDS